MRTGPHWLAPSASIGGGMWPLGLETAGFTIVDQLLPGFTNTTIRPRYYAFFAWTFWTYERHRDRTLLSQAEWRARLEMLLRLCTKQRDPTYTGLFGNDSVAPISVASDEMVSLYRDYIPSAFVPAAYSSSFGKLGCAVPTEVKGEVQLTDAVGVPLAEAFDRSVRRDPSCAAALEWVLCDAMEIPAEVVFELAHALSLRPVSPGEPEHQALTDLLIRMRPAGDPGQSAVDEARSRSLGLLLELLATSPGGLPDRSAPHRLFATSQLPDGTAFRPSEPFAQTWSAWQRYQERQFEKVGIYGFWSVFIELLREGASRPADALTRLQAAMEEDPLLHAFLGENPFSWSVRDAREWLLSRAREDGGEVGAMLDEFSARIRNRTTPLGERAAASLLMLLLVTAAWEDARMSLDPSLVRLHKTGGAGRISLESLTQEFIGRGPAGLEGLLRWILGTAVVGQANRVAMEKIARGEAHVFLFQDEAGYRVRPGLGVLDYVGYDEPRIHSGYRLMEGLGLVEIDGGYRITNAGRNVLAEVRAHCLKQNP